MESLGRREAGRVEAREEEEAKEMEVTRRWAAGGTAG